MNFVEVCIQAGIDSGELLAMLEGGEALGAWESEGALHLYWPEDKWNPGTLADLERALALFGIEDTQDVIAIRSVPDQDWNAAWAASLQPIRLGRRLRVRQTWHAPDPALDGIELVIDPKRAFGTGYHATTQLVIEWLEENIHGGEHALDVGTGSGILAMAAIRLGAASALGIDNDPVAIECATEYVLVNGFGSALELRVSSFEDPNLAGFDVVLANLDIRTMPLLCPHLPRLLKVGGRACLSGLQPQDLDEVTQALTDSGLRIVSRADRSDWISLSIIKD